MTKKKQKSRFQTLTKREKEVLQLVCQHNSYQRIADKLFISKSTVKAHMHNIYVKLDLDYLERDERIMQIHNTYCPFFMKDEQVMKSVVKSNEKTEKPELTEESKESEDQSHDIQDIQIEPEHTFIEGEFEEVVENQQSNLVEQKTELELEPDPITPEEEKIIDGDEMALVTYKQKPIKIGGKEEVGTGRKRGCVKFVFTLILGGLMVIGGLYTWNNYVKDIPIVQSIIQLINPDAVIESSPSAPSSSSPSSTSPSDSSSSMSSSSDSETIIEKILPKTDPYADAVELGDWFKKDDVWVRISEYEVTGTKVALYIEVWNKTGHEYFFSWNDNDNFSMVDNKNNKYDVLGSYERKVNLDSDERMRILGQNIGTVGFDNDSLYKPGVTDLYVEFEYFATIESAVFHIDLNK